MSLTGAANIIPLDSIGQDSVVIKRLFKYMNYKFLIYNHVMKIVKLCGGHKQN